jgi:hypothetical protein
MIRASATHDILVETLESGFFHYLLITKSEGKQHCLH